MKMPVIDSYESAAEYLRAGRNPAGRPLPGKRTRLMRRGTAIAIQYRGTDVVTYARDGRIALDRGGWNTRTTADRIDCYSPMRVLSGGQESGWTGNLIRHGDHVWEVGHPDGTRSDLRDAEWFTPSTGRAAAQLEGQTV